ncbi:MAG: hypothetical protein KF764_29775 [Labilithrix sp.]|nr:hypothetical protein [Labilithrix sp.]
MKTALALALTLASLTLLAGCPDNNPKPGTTPAASAGAPATSASAAEPDKAGNGW